MRTEEIGRGGLWKKLKKVMRSLKRGQAVGNDGLPEDVWKYKNGGSEKMDVRFM